MLDAIRTYQRSQPSRTAVVDLVSEQSWTYLHLSRDIDRCAHWLAEKLGGGGTGKRVGVLAKNCAEMVIFHLACTRAGAIFIPFNWRLADAERNIICEDCEPSIILSDDGQGPSAFDGPCFDIRAAFKEAAGAPHKETDPAWTTGWDDISVLLYTSGTSGKPKGVQLSEANFFWGGTNFNLGNDVSPASVFLCNMPLFHVAGLGAAVRAPLLAGAKVLISDGFKAERTLARIADPVLGVTHYFCVPQMAQMLWNAPGFKPEMLRGLTTLTTGGAPNPKAQIDRFIDAKIPLADGFGMTETMSNFNMPITPLERIKSKAGSCGLPLVAIQARIIDENGDEVGPNQSGELLVKGPSISSGYWNNPEQTEKAFRDGWFHTGDVAMKDDDGFYYIVDRKKDMFISGGENVYPAEVEAAISEMANVAEIAIVGVPDEKWGEVGCAFYSWVKGKEGAGEDIKAHCLDRLAKFKVPKQYVQMDTLPRTGSGKTKKHVLLKMWKDGEVG